MTRKALFTALSRSTVSACIMLRRARARFVLLLHGYPFLWYLWRHQIKGVSRGRLSGGRPRSARLWPNRLPSRCRLFYDMTHLVGDVVGLMKAVDSKSAVLIGHDFGSPVAYNTALMRTGPRSRRLYS